MYFWKAKALARDLKENKVSEKEQMGYYLLPGIAFLPGNYSISWLESAIGITVFVLGTIWCFQTNRRGDNKDFIVRMTCLNVPVFVRLAVFAQIISAVIFSISIIIARFFFNTSFAEIRAFKTYIPYLVTPLLFVAYFSMLRFYLLDASGARTSSDKPPQST